MGGEGWSNFAPFDASVEAALEALRERVFAAGLYRGSEERPATIEETVENAAESGTASILDITGVSDGPDFCSVCPLPAGEVERLFGTTRPDHGAVADNYELFEDIERGQGIYTVVYKDGQPSELFFAGVSFD